MSLKSSAGLQDDGQQHDQNEIHNEAIHTASTRQEAKFKLPKLENDNWDRNTNLTGSKHSPRLENSTDRTMDWTQKHFRKRNTEYTYTNRNKNSSVAQFPKLNSGNVENNKESNYKRSENNAEKNTNYKISHQFSNSETTVNTTTDKKLTDKQFLDSDITSCRDKHLINRWGSEDDSEVLWQQEKTVSEVRHLATTLGLDSHVDRQPNCKASNIRWRPVKESATQQWWKQSKKWTKHTGDIKTKHKARPQNDRQAAKKYVKGRRRDPIVNVPGIGCSYRLPVVSKRTVK